MNTAIKFSDISDQLYTVPLPKAQQIPPMPSPDPSHWYADITYPFRERSIVERIIKSRGSDTLKIVVNP
jgi:hypothetical protein